MVDVLFLVIVLFAKLTFLIDTENRNSKPTLVLPFSCVQHMGDGLLKNPFKLNPMKNQICKYSFQLRSGIIMTYQQKSSHQSNIRYGSNIREPVV